MLKKKLHPELRKLLLFSGIFLVINAGLTLYFKRVSIRNHKLLKQERVFKQAPDAIDVMIMGHSRPYKAIDASLLGNSVNFCSGGESSVYTYYKLKYVLEESGKSVKTVLMPAGFPSINLTDPNVNSNSFYWKRYVDYCELAAITDDHEAYTSLWLKSRTIPWYEYGYLKLASMTGDINFKTDKKVFKEGNEADNLALAESIISRMTDTRSMYDSVSLHYVQKTMELCKKHHVQLVYIKYPVSKPYRSAVKRIIEAKNLQDATGNFEKIIASHSEIEFWDYGAYWGENDMYFVDPQHINKEGQRLFTLLIKTRLERL